MEHLSSYFHELVIHFGYAGLFVVMFLGNIGMPTGTEIVVLLVDAMKGPQNADRRNYPPRPDADDRDQ